MTVEQFKERLAEKDIEAWYEVKHVIVDRKNKITTQIRLPNSRLFHSKK
jgi:hypothetical protein